MGNPIVEKYLKPKKYQTEQLRTAEESDVIDPRIKIDLRTRELILKYRLTNRIQPTLSIPLAYNSSRGVFELIETPSMITSRLQAYYYTTSPRETTPDFYNLRVDSAHRLYVIDDQALQTLNSLFNSIGDAGTNPQDSQGETMLKILSDTKQKLNSLFNSIGDAGTNPQDSQGETMLKILSDTKSNIYSLYKCFSQPSNAETFTTTPLGANATYYSPSRDFYESRLSVMNVMGYADQATAPNGVYIQLSIDGTNWDYQGATATLSAAGAVSLSQVVTARYARAVWVNGATAQSVFRFGGRYAIAGSENPTISLAPPTQIDPVCSICGKDMTDTSDFFVEDGKVYCPKCYANKRWKEAKDKKQWLQGLKAWRKIAKDEEFNRTKLHTPDDAEDEVS